MNEIQGLKLANINDYSDFQKEAAALLDRAPADQIFAVVYADLLHFQAVNDIYGIPEGNRLLEEFAAFWAGSSRTRVFGRIYADHFIKLVQLEPERDIEEISQ